MLYYAPVREYELHAIYILPNIDMYMYQQLFVGISLESQYQHPHFNEEMILLQGHT